tara:strand:- start:7930 stop:9702 length:1773 start_codon:yes stop_codon:yes gene_type:complete
MSIFEELIKLKEAKLISDLEVEFARTLLRISPDLSPTVLVAAVICSFHQINGNVCIFLDRIHQDKRIVDLLCLLPSHNTQIEALMNELQASSVVGSPGEFKPLILEENRLYIQRYWKYENELVAWIKERTTRESSKLTKEVIETVQEQFKANTSDKTDWQKVAVFLSVLKDFLIISGGPGTGKTFTVRKIIETIQGSCSIPKRIALAAPTGKAAQRLSESFQNDSSNEIGAQTIHKLLGARMDGSFAFGKNRKLPYDVVIVDEASMLDIRLWIQLIRALSDQTKLIVLGDKDQLSSVEAGAVLGDICQGAENIFSKNLVETLSGCGVEVGAKEIETESLNDCIVLLTKSYRFGAQSGLKLLSEAINTENPTLAFEILTSSEIGDVHWIEPDINTIPTIIKRYCVDVFSRNSKESPGQQFEAYTNAQILCAIRKGDFGIERVNREAELTIKTKAGISRGREWFDGRFVLFTKNDSFLKVQNGETGIFFTGPNSEGKVMVEGNENRQISVSRVKEYQPAYAITVHKSQGSEFENVVLILPNEHNPIITKELLYTAVTRARQNLLVVGSRGVVEQAILQRISRNSGLATKLWG